MPRRRQGPVQLRLCDCRVCLADPSVSLDPVSKKPVLGKYIAALLYERHQITESQQADKDDSELSTETILQTLAPGYTFPPSPTLDNLQSAHPLAESQLQNRKMRRERERELKRAAKTQDEDCAASLQFFQWSLQIALQGFSPPNRLTFVYGPSIPYTSVEESDGFPHPLSGSFALDKDALENQSIISHFDKLSELYSDVIMTPTPSNGDLSNVDIRKRLLEKLRDELKKVEAIRGKEWERQRSEGRSRRPEDGTIFADRYYSKSLLQREPSILVALFVVLVMHLLCGVSQARAGFLLEGFKASHRALLTRNGVVLDDETDAVIRSMGTDVRTVLDAFEPEIEPVTTAWVCCPMCYKLYTNEDTSKRTCDHTEFEGGPACGASLYRTQRIRGKNRCHPIRRYIHQPLGHWLARLLARPGIEKLMDDILPQATQTPAELHDIWDASEFRSFMGPDGKPFVLRNGPEGRLMFGLSFDGFNPHGVMAAGKRGSVGAIYMVCFNLPSHIRFRTENMYLVGIAPGPNEPSREQINHLLKPVVDELKLFWKPGVFISRTPSCRDGRRFLAALGPIIGDTPAARQLSGFAPPSAHNFCPYCHLQSKDKENVDYGQWLPRTYEDHKAHAAEWKEADTQKEREAIYKAHGVRWSVLLELDYWDPLKFTVIDPMHSILLGALRYHCREVWGMDVNRDEDDGTTLDEYATVRGPPTTNELAFAEECLLMSKSLSSFRPVVLKHLCADRDLRYVGTKGDLGARLKKWQIEKGILDESGGLTAETKERRKEAAKKPSPAAMALAQETLFEGTDTSMKKLNSAVLRQLCYDHHLTIPGKPKASQLVNFLLEWREKQGYGAMPSKGKPKVVLGSTILKELWRDIESSDCPSWLGRATRLGEGSHGKLSADQWRTACTVDLVYTLIKLWATPDEQQDKLRFQEMLKNFMDLVNATKLALRRTMTVEIAEEYQTLMQRYVEGIIRLYPGRKVQPHHHALLHLGSMLKRFGPSHSWRMFGFERFNRILQLVKTNGRWGQMEITMMLGTCRGANLRSLLLDETAPRALRDMIRPFENVFRSDTRGTLLSDMAAGEDFTRLLPGGARPKPLDELNSCLRPLLLAKLGRCYTTTFPFSLQKVYIQGVDYHTSGSSSKGCYILYGPSSNEHWMAGQIQYILAYPREDREIHEYLLVINRYRSLSEEHASLDPFRKFEGGGRLYYDSFESQFDIVREESVQCHFRKAVHDNSEIGVRCVHALPLDR